MAPLDVAATPKSIPLPIVELPDVTGSRPRFERSAPPDPARRHFEALVRTRVLGQGNFFIKSFLRDKELRIGATKADFERNLLAGFDEGRLHTADLLDWLHEVDGWGKQWMYPFEVRSRSHLARDLRRAFAAQGLPLSWDQTAWDPAVELPELPTLACATFDDVALRLAWGRAAEVRKREPEKDRKETIRHDRYEFDAYRLEKRVRVLRFEVRFDLELAALFVPLSIPREEHGLDSLLPALADLLGSDVAARPLSISDVIKNVDQAEARTQGRALLDVNVESARLGSGGAAMEFASERSGKGVAEVGGSVAAARAAALRTTAELRTFLGERARLGFLASGKRVDQDVRVALFGATDAVRIDKQLSAHEVWAILGLLGEYR